MTMRKSLAAALNDQINHEFSAAYVYLGMAAYFETLDLGGFAGWMRAQSEEEWGHGMRIYEHLAARDVPVTLSGLDQAETEYDGPESVIASALDLEQGTTRAINAVYARSLEQGDFQAKAMLDWFVERADRRGGHAPHAAQPGQDRRRRRRGPADPRSRTGGTPVGERRGVASTRSATPRPAAGAPALQLSASSL